MCNVQEEVGRFYELVGHDTERLFNLPELEDPQKLTAMVLLRDAMNGAFFIGSRLLFSISMKMVEITDPARQQPTRVCGLHVSSRLHARRACGRLRRRTSIRQVGAAPQ